MRVVSEEPLYWKARNLDVFDGAAWTVRTEPARYARGDEPFEADVPRDWDEHARGRRRRSTFSVRRMRIREVVGAGPTRAVA